MTLDDILKKLESLGNEKMRQLHIKNGAGKQPQFGVKLGDIRNLANTIKKGHDLGLELWETGNIDARLLATLLFVPKNLSVEQLDKMVRETGIPQVSDWLYSYVIKEHPDKETLRMKWMSSKDPMAARAGWSLTSGRVAREPEGLDLVALLKRIETDMPKASPEEQWTMNSTLANIGINFPEHRERAIAIGEKLGIYRDYPVSKGCTSPFAPIWIGEMVKRKG